MGDKNIFPQIKNISFTEQTNNKVVSNPLLPNLITCYVEDMGTTINYVSKERLKELKLTMEEINTIALKNLNNLDNTENGYRIMDNQDGTKSISYETHDSYDATRLLLLFSAKLDLFISILGDPFVVAIPCRDFLLAAPASYENKLGSYAKKLFDEKPFPLTQEIILFSKNKETFS